MKKSVIIGSVVILVGLLIFVGAFWAMDFDWEKFDTEGTVETVKIIDFVGKEIVIEEDNGGIIFGTSPDGKVHITYGKSKNRDLEIENGETLKIKRTDNRKWYDMIVISVKVYDTTILLPENFDGNLSVTTNNGKIEVKDGAFENLNLKTDNGKIVLKNAKVNDSVAATANNGKILFDEVLSTEMKAETKNGSVELKNITSPKISAKTHNGDVKISDLESGDISLEAKNGYIKGTLSGNINDYSVISNTKNGRNNLPEQTFAGDKKLYVKTYNGDIKINFK